MEGLLGQGLGDASPVPGPRPAPEDAPLPLHRSLRGKGLVATAALLAYVFVAGWSVASGRSEILAGIAALDGLSQHEKALLLAEACVAEARMEAEAAAGAPTANAGAGAPCGPQLTALEAFDPAYALIDRALQRSHAGSVGARAPGGAATPVPALRRAADDLEIRRRGLAEQRERLRLDVQRRYDAVTIDSLALAAIGLAVFGTLAAWFFARLAGDIRRLEAHTRRIVQGRRGIEMSVGRDDELGRLMQAVNHIAVELDQREQQIELENLRRAHGDKMLSVGALAAGIAHEVNNPLAAIIGSAQALRETASAGVPPPEDMLRSIIAQAERAAGASRQLAELAAPEGAEPDWVDLNAMLRRVVQLNGYDRRYRHLALEMDFDPALPALRTAGQSLRQVLMQLLSIACDAMLARPPHDGPLRLATCIDGGRVGVELELAAPLDLAAPAVQRALLVCGALVEPQGGRLVLRQGEGGVRHLRLELPADTGTDPG